MHQADELGCGRTREHGPPRNRRPAGRGHTIRSEISACILNLVVLTASIYAAVEQRGHPSSQDGEAVGPADYQLLSSRNLTVPVVGAGQRDILDTFNEARPGGKRHEATDILAPKGTPVVAVDAGSVKKLFYSVRGGLTVYQFDGSETYCYYYAHLDRYGEGLHEGESVKRGDRIGYVGTSGDAQAGNPHLHFAIYKLDREKRWWKGAAINPYPILTHSAR